MTPGELIAILQQVQPFEPSAVALLRERRRDTGELYPDPSEMSRAKIIRAMTELNNYVKASADMAEKLSDLQPIAIKSSEVAEIGAYCL